MFWVIWNEGKGKYRCYPAQKGRVGKVQRWNTKEQAERHLTPWDRDEGWEVVEESS